MRRLSLLIALLGFFSWSPAAEKKTEERDELAAPIPELRLTNGTVFRQVTVVRYETERVVLKSSAGVGGISYQMIPEPLRSKMLAARDQARAAGTAATRAANVKAAEDSAKQQAAAAAAERERQRLDEVADRRALAVGMTPAQAVRAWGEPRKKNITSGGFEQWIYETPERGRTYVYFRGGLLSSWQATE